MTRRDVRSWHEAGLARCLRFGHFWRQSGHQRLACHRCPFGARPFVYDFVD
jgi:hypothetical protein